MYRVLYFVGEAGLPYQTSDDLSFTAAVNEANKIRLTLADSFNETNVTFYLVIESPSGYWRRSHRIWWDDDGLVHWKPHPTFKNKFTRT